MKLLKFSAKYPDEASCIARVEGDQRKKATYMPGMRSSACDGGKRGGRSTLVFYVLKVSRLACPENTASGKLPCRLSLKA